MDAGFQPMQRLSGQPAPSSQEEGAAVRAEPMSLRPKGVGELLDQSLEVFQRRFFACVLTAFCIWLPSRVLASTYLAVSSEEDQTSALIRMLVEIGLGTLISGAVAQVSYAALRGEELPLSEGLKRVLKALPRMISVLVFLAILLGMVWVPALIAGVALGPVVAFLAIALAGPWTFFIVWRSVLAQIIAVLEYDSPPQALRRSFRLTKGSLGRWLALIVVSTCLTLPLQWAANSFVDGTAQAWLLRQLPILGDRGVEVLSWLLSAACLSVPAAFSAVTLTALYVDQRVRLEGFDLTLRLQRREEEWNSRPTQPQPPVAGELA